MLKDDENKIDETTKEVDAIADHHTIEHFYYSYRSAPMKEDNENEIYETSYEVAMTSLSTTKYCLVFSSKTLLFLRQNSVFRI